MFERIESSKRGQSAIEFIILIGAMFFIFLTMLFVIQGNITDKTRENRDLVIRELGLTVQSEITLAAESSNGYYREFVLPPTLLGLEYDVRIIDDLVFLNTTNGRHAIAFSVVEVVGDAQVGLNVIEKNNGVVYLNINP
jgi:hypothetical protein